VRALLVALLLAAAPAAAGTPRKHTILIVKHDPPTPVVLTIDGGERVMHVKLTKLAKTPPPACKTDRRGVVRCVITY
jgi:hypothetical protein